MDPEETGPWEGAIQQLRAWDPSWAEACERMTTNPWRSGILPRRLVELIGVAVNAACTNLNPEVTGGTSAERSTRAPRARKSCSF